MMVIFFAQFMRRGPETVVGLLPLVLLGPYLYQELVSRLLARLFGTVEGDPKLYPKLHGDGNGNGDGTGTGTGKRQHLKIQETDTARKRRA
ncbi:hypothetical protein Tco_1478436 [Tanacetum coccineum]